MPVANVVDQADDLRVDGQHKLWNHVRASGIRHPSNPNEEKRRSWITRRGPTNQSAGESAVRRPVWAWRRLGGPWPEALKPEIVAASFAPGSSVSIVARHHELNANQSSSWRHRFRSEPRARTVR